MTTNIDHLLGKFHNVESKAFMQTLPDNCIDLTVTSPPYDNLRTYNGFVFDFEGIAKELFRITKDGGVVVWIVNDETIDGSETGTSFKQALFFMSCGFNLHDTMIWDKGSCRYPDETRYYACWEYMFILSKGKPKTFNRIEDRANKYVGSKVARASQIRTVDGRMMANSAFTSCPERIIKEMGSRFNIWDIPVSASVGDKIALEHPASFSQNLAEDHILSWSNPGDIVYDCFMGSGTVAKMAERNNRKWLGTEISAEYVAIANKRIEAERAQLKLF